MEQKRKLSSLMIFPAFNVSSSRTRKHKGFSEGRTGLKGASEAWARASLRSAPGAHAREGAALMELFTRWSQEGRGAPPRGH